MSHSGTVVLAVGLLAVLGAAVGTGGFSATAADRGVQVRVVDDDSAYLGFAQATNTSDGTTNLTVTVTNQFPSGVALAVNVSVGNETTTLATLGPGDTETVGFVAVDCGEPITVDAEGDGVSVRLERTVACS